jgi:hypothetical protein
LPRPIREQRERENDERKPDDELSRVEPPPGELEGERERSIHGTSVSSCTGMSNA